MESGRSLEAGFAVFLLWSACCASLVRPTSAQNAAQQDCERTDANGTRQYRACQADTEALYNLNIAPRVEPANHTCGYSNNEVYCTLDLYNLCSLCDAANESFAHPPEYSYDQPVTDQLTWWQSITWHNYPVPLEVDLILSLNHSYMLGSEIKIVFQSSRPRRMVLEKSSDYGQTWQPYQYYADSCDYFQMAAADTVRTPTEVICSESYSSGSSSAQYAGGAVLFDVWSRLHLVTDSPFPEDFQRAYENDTELMAFLELTDLRLRLLHPATDSLEWTGLYYYLVQYYYAISNIETFLICNCNMHGKFCYQNNDVTVCRCYHNTMGKNCEQCLPLYNNRPWQPGSAIPFPDGTANECQECDCSEHSDNCTYSASLGRGVCDNCRDNTAGMSCEICISGYYRNVSVPASSLDSCIECICEPLGTIENSTCSQYATDGKPVGQCDCRSNIEGRACDMCTDQYYGLLLNDGLGTCKDCNCNLLGTVNASNVCEKQAGACPCKPNTDTRTCAECKDGYYGYPTTESEDCLACDCNLGGSTSPICNKVSGRCACRGNITDRRCSLTDQGYYFEFLDSNSYDAWDAESDCLTTSATPSNLFTGRGFQTCYQGNRVAFRGVAAITNLADALFYRPILRYTYQSASAWQLATLAVAFAQPSVGASSLCPQTAGSPVTTLFLSLPPGTATAWYAPEGQALSLDRRCRYDFTLTLNDRGAGDQEIEIDSLVVMPTATSFSVFTQADVPTQQFYTACISNMTAIGTREFAINQCRDFMFGVSAESKDGAVECDCDPVGSISSTCRSYGGGCECKLGIGGTRCDRCMPGFYGLQADGCTPCNCDPTGSYSLACDFVSGQCPCKSNVAPDGQLTDEGSPAGLQCRSCLADHYGFSSGGGCVPCGCNPEGSLTQQCSATGDCLCKETVAGRQCSDCVPGSFLFSANGCTPCDCNPDGSIGSTCHPTEGTCPCKANAQGVKCGQCRPGYFNLQPGNADGCQPCFCHGHSGQCAPAPSYVPAAIVADFTAGSAATSRGSWSATDPAALTAGPDSLRVVHPLAPPVQDYVYLLAPSPYLGHHLELYGQTLSYTMKLDTGVVDTASSQYLIVTGGRNSTDIYYSLESFVPSLTETQFQAIFYETNWRVVGDARAPTVAEFQEILSDITAIRIRASFGPGTVSTFFRVAMDTAQYVTNPEDYTSFATTVEQCSCDPSSNTMGLSCQQCQQGAYRQNAVDTPSDPCLPCQCNSRASTCDPVTGVCQSCQLGTVGDHCEDCAANVQETRCNQCIPDHYGFGTDLFGGACSACGCNMTGTGGVTQCDMQTGQCPCTGNYGGMFCDSCQFNFYDYVQGCLPCDRCYDSISAEHDNLRLQSANLTGFLGSLTAADTSASLGPFYDRLMAAYSQMLQLVEKMAAVIRETGTLTSTVVSLNTTMQQLLASLSGAIKTGTETAEANLASVEGLVGQAQQAIAAVEQALVQADAGLTSGDIQSTQSALSQLNSDLAALRAQLAVLSSSAQARENALEQKVLELTAVAQETVLTAEQALTTAQQAQSVHDDTTTRTAALLTRANEVAALGRQTELAVSEVGRRAELAKTAGGEGTEAALLASIAEIASGADAAIGSSVFKSNEAMMIEAQALAQQASNAQVIADLADTRTQTESLVTAADATLNDVSARYDRVVAANQSATEAVASSEATFRSAEEMLTIVQNFDSQSTAAQTAADTALLQEAGIQALSADVDAQAIALRAELTGAGSDAQEGLSGATLALQTAQAEEQAVRPVSQKATQLTDESSNKLQGTGTIADSIRTINATQLQPAVAQCDAHSPDLQTLEAQVAQANTEAQSVADQAQATRATVDSLLAETESIQLVSLDDLPGLMDRIGQTRAAFTQGDFARLIASLARSVQSQQAWLETKQAQAIEIQSQINALESFRVT